MDIRSEENKKYTQEKARLQRQEILLEIKKRKMRISNFIRVGEIMERCHISSVDHKILAGGFLFLHASLKDQTLVSEWAKQGESYVAKTAIPKKDLDVLQVVFRTTPPEAIRQSLWKRGFICENTEQIWEGNGLKKEIEALVSHHGNVYKMKKKDDK